VASETPALRPLSVAEILDAAFRLYRRRFVPLVTIAAVVYVPLGIVQAVLVGLFLGSVMKTPTPGQDLFGFSTPMIVGAAGGGLLLYGLWLIGYAIVYAALAVAISRSYLGAEVRPADAYAQVTRNIGPLLVTWLIVGLITFLGFLLCVIPGVYAAVALSFAWPLVVLEGLGPGAAVNRSAELVKGYWWRVFGTMLLFGLIVAVIQAAVSMPFGIAFAVLGAAGAPGLAQGLQQLVSTLLGMLLLPLTMTGLVILYYDLRVRKEAFDLQLMADQIGSRLGVEAKLPAAEGPVAPAAAGPIFDERPTGEGPAAPAMSEDLPPPPEQAYQEAELDVSPQESWSETELPPPPGAEAPAEAPEPAGGAPEVEGPEEREAEPEAGDEPADGDSLY